MSHVASEPEPVDFAKVQDRAGADLTITDVAVPEEVPPGDPVDVEVTVRDDSGGTAPGEDWNQGWVIVTVDPGVDPFVIWKCFIIQPGQTVTVDDCATTIGNCLDGEFDMPDQDTVVNVRAGGFSEGTDCVQAATAGQRTDEMDVPVAVQTFDETNIEVESCGVSPRDIDMNEQGTLTAIIRNNNPVATTQRASFGLETSCQPTPILQESVAFTLQPGGAAEVSLTFSPENPLADSGGCVAPGEYELRANAVDVQPATAAQAAGAPAEQTIKVSAREVPTQRMSADPTPEAPAAASCGTLTIREPFDPDLVTIPACGQLSPSDPLPGDVVTMTFTVENQNPVGAEYGLDLTVGGQNVSIISGGGRRNIGPNTQDRGLEVTFEAPQLPGQSPVVELDTIDVTQVSGFSLGALGGLAQGATDTDRGTLLTGMAGVGAGVGGLLASRLGR